MMLLARVSRLEQDHTSGNPLEQLTDEELEAGIEALNQRLAEAIGSSGEGMVDIPVDMDEHQLRALVARIKSRNGHG